MNVFPLKFKQADDETFLFRDDAGGFFRADRSFLDRYALARLTDHDTDFLEANGHAFREPSDLNYSGYVQRWARRLHQPGELNYLILVPTLRCNLACGYCQVSRVNETTPGFDWDENTLSAIIRFIDGLSTKRIKIEFQGGEPLLRLDLLNTVRNFARERFEEASFVVCTNLQLVSEEAWKFFDSPDTTISTSLDGNFSAHQRQRTFDADRTEAFRQNLSLAVERFGPGKVSALPTLDTRNLPPVSSVIDTYRGFGFRSIYLRPVNYQGFARKRYATSNLAGEWTRYYSSFIDELIRYNSTAEMPMEEYYFTHCLRRVLRGGHDNHVDLRNPNILGKDYLVIDHDGTFYPTDEARMVTRVGQIDLSLGSVHTSLDQAKIATLNAEASNNFHPDCIHCPYQPFCGVDLIDDLSRYGRIDLPKHQTAFCERHTGIFDKVFELLYSKDPIVHKSLAVWAGVPEFEQRLAKVHQ